eukprot:7164564-Prymnesium_polylepis.1
MTISWLMPLDNAGRFALSMNQQRFSAQMLAQNPYLVLSVATTELVPLLLKVGRCRLTATRYRAAKPSLRRKAALARRCAAVSLGRCRHPGAALVCAQLLWPLPRQAA